MTMDGLAEPTAETVSMIEGQRDWLVHVRSGKSVHMYAVQQVLHWQAQDRKKRFLFAWEPEPTTELARRTVAIVGISSTGFDKIAGWSISQANELGARLCHGVIKDSRSMPPGTILAVYPMPVTDFRLEWGIADMTETQDEETENAPEADEGQAERPAEA